MNRERTGLPMAPPCSEPIVAAIPSEHRVAESVRAVYAFTEMTLAYPSSGGSMPRYEFVLGFSEND